MQLGGSVWRILNLVTNMNKNIFEIVTSRTNMNTNIFICWVLVEYEYEHWKYLNIQLKSSNIRIGQKHIFWLLLSSECFGTIIWPKLLQIKLQRVEKASFVKISDKSNIQISEYIRWWKFHYSYSNIQYSVEILEYSNIGHTLLGGWTLNELRMTGKFLWVFS